MKLAAAPACALVFAGICFGQPARGNAAAASPAAVATNAEVSYCFARKRGLDPGIELPAYLVLKMRVTVAYRNAGTRALIVPLERERTIYTGFKPGELSVFRDHLSFFDPSVKPMKSLPPDVSPDSPVSPKNDVFGVIPAGGEMLLPSEEIALPVNRSSEFKQSPDLRGRTVYVALRFAHRDLSAALRAQLTDRWSRFGVPWTGLLTTNTIQVDVPPAPQATPCQDDDKAAHKAVGVNLGK